MMICLIVSIDVIVSDVSESGAISSASDSAVPQVGQVDSSTWICGTCRVTLMFVSSRQQGVRLWDLLGHTVQAHGVSVSALCRRWY
jgi:hypothetical protein